MNGGNQLIDVKGLKNIAYEVLVFLNTFKILSSWTSGPVVISLESFSKLREIGLM